jgi:hypothetical protein
MLVLFAFAAVKSGNSGLDMVHAFMLVVTHPIADVPPEATVPGTAASTIFGSTTLMEHCAPAELPVALFTQESVYVARLTPAGGIF